MREKETKTSESATKQTDLLVSSEKLFLAFRARVCIRLWYAMHTTHIHTQYARVEKSRWREQVTSARVASLTELLIWKRRRKRRKRVRWSHGENTVAFFRRTVQRRASTTLRRRVFARGTTEYRVGHTFREIHTASSAVQRINDTQDRPVGDREDVSSTLRLYHRELRNPAISAGNVKTRKP